MRKYFNDKRKIIPFFLAALVLLMLIFTLTWGEAIYRTAYIVSNVVPGVPKWFD